MKAGERWVSKYDDSSVVIMALVDVSYEGEFTWITPAGRFNFSANKIFTGIKIKTEESDITIPTFVFLKLYEKIYTKEGEDESWRNLENKETH